MKLTACVLCVLSAGVMMAAETDEPSLGYTLTLGGKTIRLIPGKETEILGTFKDPKVTLEADGERLFTYGGMTFKYPANFAFEADFETPGVKIWSLDGSDFVIMIEKFDREIVTPESFAKDLQEMYGEETNVKEKSITIHGKELKGMEIRAEVAGTVIIQNVLAIPSKKGSRLLILQDLAPDLKISNKESKNVYRLLNETLDFIIK